MSSANMYAHMNVHTSAQATSVNNLLRLLCELSLYLLLCDQLNVSAFEERVAKHAFTALKQVNVMLRQVTV